MDKKLKQLKQQLERVEKELAQLAEIKIAIAELEGINEREPALRKPTCKKLAGVFPVSGH